MICRPLPDKSSTSQRQIIVSLRSPPFWNVSNTVLWSSEPVDNGPLIWIYESFFNPTTSRGIPTRGTSIMLVDSGMIQVSASACGSLGSTRNVLPPRVPLGSSDNSHLSISRNLTLATCNANGHSMSFVSVTEICSECAAEQFRSLSPLHMKAPVTLEHMVAESPFVVQKSTSLNYPHLLIGL